MIIPNSVDEVDWENWQFTERAVLTFINDGNKWLLIHKKRGLGQGKINAPGGRIEKGETEIEAAIRETQEEVGLTPSKMRESGTLNFIFKDGYSLHGTIFIADYYEGTLIETDEADPFWCNESEIPYDNMWEDDQYWLPYMLQGKYIVGQFIFDDDRMVSKNVVLTEKQIDCGN